MIQNVCRPFSRIGAEVSSFSTTWKVSLSRTKYARIRSFLSVMDGLSRRNTLLLVWNTLIESVTDDAQSCTRAFGATNYLEL